MTHCGPRRRPTTMDRRLLTRRVASVSSPPGRPLTRATARPRGSDGLSRTAVSNPTSRPGSIATFCRTPSTRRWKGAKAHSGGAAVSAQFQRPSRSTSAASLTGAFAASHPGFTKIFSIEASMSRFCRCGPRWRSIRAHRGLSRLNAASAMCSLPVEPF